jgi:hypothetical protein
MRDYDETDGHLHLDHIERESEWSRFGFVWRVVLVFLSMWLFAVFAMADSGFSEGMARGLQRTFPDINQQLREYPYTRYRRDMTIDRRELELDFQDGSGLCCYRSLNGQRLICEPC